MEIFLSKTLLYSDLANNMAGFVNKMVYIEDYCSYLSHMLKHCQYYVNWVNSGHTNVANISACYSTLMLICAKDNGSEIKEHTVINAVEPEKVYSEYEGGLTR